MKPALSAKKRPRKGPDDPIVRAWREINRSPVPPVTTLDARIAVLACMFPPFVGVDLSTEPAPDGFEARIDELYNYLERAGELDPDEDLLEDVQPFVREVQEGLRSDDELGGTTVPAPSEATLDPDGHTLHWRAWHIVNREFPDSLGARIVNAVRLVYLALADSALAPSTHEQKAKLMGDVHQAFCTWLLEHRSVLLTDAEVRALLSFQAPPLPS